MRFVILTHDHPFVHWDLLLQTGGSCRSWRLLAPPDTPAALAAETLPDHRVFYLDYEGPVSGNRGVVRRWDVGPMVWRTNRPDLVRAWCWGDRWQGELTLQLRAGRWWAWLQPGRPPGRLPCGKTC